MSSQDYGLIWESLTEEERGFFHSHSGLTFDFSKVGGRGLLVCVGEEKDADLSIAREKYTVAEYKKKFESPSP